MTVALIAANVIVSIWQWLLPQEASAILLHQAALVPARLGGGSESPGLPPALTLVTSQFLHGGPLHLAGNMLFLWIFGNNVEDALGSLRFLAFYLLCGIMAGMVHTFTQPGSTIPTVGASGAVSGILGAYALLFPRARIHTLVLLLFYISVVRVPAILWVGIWLLIQVLQGIGARGATGGVAWFAHVGGLVGGLILLPLMRPRRVDRRIGPFDSSWSTRATR